MEQKHGDGEEKLYAVARHIAKTLGRENDDVMQILSNFDGRFSRDKLLDKDSQSHSLSLKRNLNILERQISPYVTSDLPVTPEFLDAVDELIVMLKSLSSANDGSSAAALIARAEDFLQHAMFRLDDEFRSLMEIGTDSYNPTGLNDSDSDLEDDAVDDEDIPVAIPVSGYDIIIDALPPGTINELHALAKRVVAAGYGTQAYSTLRREFLTESLARLGLGPTDAVTENDWHEIEDRIDRWIKAANVAVRILFPSERRLCDRIFLGFSSSAADLCFMEVCRAAVMRLTTFADTVATACKSSPEKLFKVLDVFDALRELLPEFYSLFSDSYCVFMRNEAVAVWKRLGEAVRGIFMELENLIRRDPPRAEFPLAGVHPITRYVINYLLAASRSRRSLEQVFDEIPAKGVDTRANPGSGSHSSLAVQMGWIMELLESNLETKSNMYRDGVSVSSVFMMNNERYIVQKVKDTELGSLLGDDWIRKQSAKVRQYQGLFMRNSWNKVSSVMRMDSNANVEARSLKEKLKSFNMYFDEACRIHSLCVIVDDQLREDLRASMIKSVVPGYQIFVSRLQNSPEIKKSMLDKSVKPVEEIEARINESFRGGSGGGSGSTGSHK